MARLFNDTSRSSGSLSPDYLWLRHIFAILLLLSVGALAQHPEDILRAHFEHKLISSGSNFPGIRLESDHFGDLCILLHERIPLKTIQAQFQWNDAQTNAHLDALEKEDLVRQGAEGKYFPRITIITARDANRYFAVPPDLVQRTTASDQGACA